MHFNIPLLLLLAMLAVRVHCEEEYDYEKSEILPQRAGIREMGFTVRLQSYIDYSGKLMDGTACGTPCSVLVQMKFFAGDGSLLSQYAQPETHAVTLGMENVLPCQLALTDYQVKENIVRGQFKVEVLVEHAVDGRRSGMVDRFELSIVLTGPEQRSNVSVTSDPKQGADKLSKLLVSYAVECKNSFYGRSCEVHCVGQDANDLGHYTCEPRTGKKLCLAGWADPHRFCKRRSACLSNTCGSEGTCEDLPLSGYNCSCPLSLTGKNCDVDVVLPCSQDQDACQNGGVCGVVRGRVTCACKPDFGGNFCEFNVCDNGPTCENGGTCLVLPEGGHKCWCPPGATDCEELLMSQRGARLQPPTLAIILGATAATTGCWVRSGPFA